jgi:hypothetical protein
MKADNVHVDYGLLTSFDYTGLMWCCQFSIKSVIVIPSISSPIFLLILPNSSSSRQRKLHHHSRQAEKHSHSPIYDLWRHGMVGDALAHRMRRGEGSQSGATHATPRPVRRALCPWSLPARSGASSTLLFHSGRALTGLIFCAIAAYFVPMLPRAL